MVNLANFTGDFEGMAIRVTEDGRFSVYDVLVAFLKPTNRKGSAGESINPRQVYKSLSDRNPEVVHFVDNLKFPGRGQRDTPVANEEGIYQILMLCPGKRGAEFRSWAAKIVRERRERNPTGNSLTPVAEIALSGSGSAKATPISTLPCGLRGLRRDTSSPIPCKPMAWTNPTNTPKSPTLSIWNSMARLPRNLRRKWDFPSVTVSGIIAPWWPQPPT